VTPPSIEVPRLDPDVESYLAALAAFDEAAGPQRTIAEQRAHFVARCRHFEGGPPPPNVEAEDVTLPARSGPVPVRLYRPGPGPRPVVVYAHGGGWVVGDLESHDAYTAELAAATGAAVVAVDYRRAPERRYPAAFDDVYGVVEHLAAAGARSGLDADRIAVAGDSAGGNLAAAVALAARDRGGPALRGQVLLYPCLDPALDSGSCRLLAQGPALTRAAMVEYWQAYLGAATTSDPYAAPPRASSLAGVCPAIVATAELDLLRDDGRAYADRLRREGVPVTHREGPGLVHGYIRARHVSGRARAELDAVAAWLRGALGAAGPAPAG
jgi:acetyl esterase